MDFETIARTPEYKEMCRQRSIWLDYCDEVERKSPLSRSDLAEIHKHTRHLLLARDASYEAYKASYGHPTGAELLLMEPEMFYTFILTGGAYLLMPFYAEFEKHGAQFLQYDIEDMTYHVLAEGGKRVALKELEQAAPHWTRSEQEIHF